MGYHSKVALCIKKELFPDFVMSVEAGSRVNGDPDGEYTPLENLFDCIDTEQSEDVVLLTADYIKWYDEYEEIAAIIQWMDRIDLDIPEWESDDSYEFCRIGEDDDDIEQRGQINHLSIRREIEFY